VKSPKLFLSRLGPASTCCSALFYYKVTSLFESDGENDSRELTLKTTHNQISSDPSWLVREVRSSHRSDQEMTFQQFVIFGGLDKTMCEVLLSIFTLTDIMLCFVIKFSLCKTGS